MERKYLGNCVRGPYEDHFCEIIMNLGQQFNGGDVVYKDFVSFSFACHFVY